MRILFLLFWPSLVFGDFSSDIEKRVAKYLDRGEWKKAEEMARGPCQQDVAMGCTLLGSSLLGQKKFNEASIYFNRACDQFEPYACRSLGRYFMKGGETGLGTLYFKRACHYGLKEMCQEVKESKQWYSPPALVLIENYRKDCKDTQSENCKSILARVEACHAPLTKNDCLMVAGYFSIHLRAKLMQSEALTRLFALHASEAAYYVSSRPTTYTYDLAPLMKDTKHLKRLNYVFGFMKSCTQKYVKKRRARYHSQEIWPASYKHHNARYMANVLAFFNTGKADECYPPGAGFQAYAIGALDPLNPTRLDVWKIDHDKRLENVQDGLPLP